MGIKAFVFDLDGTILHTLPDLVIAANDALERMGFPVRTYDEILGFMGDGGARLIERVVPAGTDSEVVWQTFDIWRDIYIASDYAHTAPFPRIEQVLRDLRCRGAKTAVLSNKFHEGTCKLAEQFFPGMFDVVRGDKPPSPRKPDPTVLLEMLSDFGVRADEAAYVGDTAVDMQVARRAGVLAVGVSWGYDAAHPLAQTDLDVIIESPAELLDLL